MKDFSNGKVQEHNLTSGRALEFHCDKGYTLQGESLALCTGNGSWSSPSPLCIRMSDTLVLYTVDDIFLFIKIVIF